MTGYSAAEATRTRWLARTSGGAPTAPADVGEPTVPEADVGLTPARSRFRPTPRNFAIEQRLVPAGTWVRLEEVVSATGKARLLLC